MNSIAQTAPRLGVARVFAYVACCAVAAINARFYIMAGSVTDAGLAVAAMRLGNVSALVWFALYAAWAIARQGDGRQGEGRQGDSGLDTWQRGDGAVLGGTLLASLLPFPLAAALAGFAAPLWLWKTSATGSTERRAALVLAAIGAQLLFGRLFLLLFGKAVLQADTMLVSWAASATAAGNVLTRTDGTNVIVSSGCSSLHNISLALLGWVALAQLLSLRVDRRLLVWVAVSLAAMITLNAARIVALVWYPQHFDMLHHGTGGAMFGWAGLVLFALIAGAGAIDASDRAKRSAVP